ncbi:hypothetical protein EMEDMD4_790004 [Sinorhizobium medicae]|uniref:Uncharacterized protein n=1 Tax=Sinorhizobium medicae TaxID=110321 RepID=A0A508X5C9_9HYPH|nr:hypothetical protein EMEDMD4_790004 [Sinorhizobium medicae]
MTSLKEEVLFLFYLLAARTEQGSETKENFKCA